MRRIREVLRLRDEFGASVRRIAAACRMPRTTVRDYLRRLESAELHWDWSSQYAQNWPSYQTNV
jgi:DNA-binding IclR family transcriptional regulator